MVGLFLLFSSSFSSAATIDTEYRVNVDSVLELKLSTCNSINNSLVEVNIEPSIEGTFKSNCQEVFINTNAPGYSLSTKASSTTLDYINPTSLNPKPTINPTTNTTTAPNTLTNDTWGFAVEGKPNFDTTYTIDNANNKYAQLLTTDIPIYQTDIFPPLETNHKFYYAARLTPNTMAGSYMTTVTYTAIGEDIPQIHLNQLATNLNITTMQQLTQSRCSTATYDPTNGGINSNNTIALTDTRNSQQYRIRKMPDDKCWMIDNMKLADITLTPADSNVTNNYNLMEISSTHGTADDTPYVDDPALNSPNKDHCINNTAAADSNFTESYSSESLTGCGYLYSFSAATARTGDGLTTDGQNATGSICPVGWRLPTGTATGDFAILNGSMLNNAPSNASTEDSSASRANWFSIGKFSGSYAGFFYGSSWNYQGVYGVWWSSTVNSSTYAYRASVNYGYLNPGAYAYGQYYGYSVRCIL